MTEPNDIPTLAPPVAPPKPGRPWARRLRKILKWVGGSLFVLVALVLLLVVFLPLQWIVQSVVLPKVHEMLDQDNITIGAVDWSLTNGLEFRDIRVGPPKGYTKDVVTLKRLAVHYELFSILSKDFQVTEVAVEDPVAFLEVRDGKTSIDAMLAHLPPSEPPPPEEPGGPPPDLKITLKKVAVTGLKASFDDGNARADFGTLDVNVAGVVDLGGKTPGKITVNVGIGGTPDGQPNVHVAVATPQEVKGAFELKTKLAVQVDIAGALDKPRAGVDLDFLFASTQLDVPGLAVPPFKLTARTEAVADIKADQAGVKLMTAHFNGEEILRMRANLDGLQKQGILAEIDRVRLPFAAFVPYAQAVLPPEAKLSLAGEAGVENLRVTGEGPKLAGGALPNVTGRLFVRGLGLSADTTGVPAPSADPAAPKPLVVVPPLAAEVADVGVEIDFALSPDAPAQDSAAIRAGLAPPGGAAEARPTVWAQGTVGVGRVDGFGAHVEKLAVNLGAGAMLTNLVPNEVATRVDVQIPVIRADVPGQGPVALSFGTQLEAGGNLIEQTFSLDRLAVNVADTIKLGVDAKIRKLGLDGFELNARVEPLSIPRALALAPPGARKAMPPGLAVGGGVDTRVHVEGTLPPLEELNTLGQDLNKVFALPVTFDITQGFNGLSVALPAAKVNVQGLNGAIRIHGKPSDVVVEGPADRSLRIDRIEKSDLGVVIRRLGLPLSLRFTPLNAAQTLDLRTGVDLAFEPPARVPAKGMALSGGLSTDLKVTAKLPPVDQLGRLGGDLGRVFALPVNIDLKQSFADLSVNMPASKLDVKKLSGILHVHGRPGDLTVETLRDHPLGIARVAAEEAGFIVEKIGLPLSLRFTPLSGENTVAARTGLTVSRVFGRKTGLRAEGISVIAEPKIKLPLLRALGGGAFDIEKLDVAADVGLEALNLRKDGTSVRIANAERAAPGSRTRVVRDQVRLTYDPQAPAADDGNRYALAIQHGLKLGNLSMREARLDVKNLVLDQKIEVAGLALSGLKLSNPVPTSKPRFVRITSKLLPNTDPDATGPENDRKLAISVGGTPLDRPIAENELDVLIKASIPRLRYPPVDPDVYAEIDRLEIQRLDFHNRSHGARLTVSGLVRNAVLNGAALPQIDLSMFAGLDLPVATDKAKGRHMITMGSEETHDKLSVTMGGKVGLEARVRNVGAQALELKGVLVGENCHIWSEKHGQDPSLADGTQLFTVQNVHVKNLTMSAPMIQRVDLDYLSAMAVDKLKAQAFFRDVSKLWPASRNIVTEQQSPLHHTMQSYANLPSNVTIDKVDIDKQVSYIKGGKVLEKANSPLVVDRVALNMGYENWVFDLKRLYIQLMGGDIGGRVAFQLKGLAPPDLDLLLQTQIGGINLAALNPRRDVKKKYSSATEVKVDANLAFGWKNRDVDGAIKVSKLSLKQLDEVLKFSDPGQRNQQIQDQRELFKSIAFLNPSVKYVNLDFEYANMDLETRLDAIPGVRGILNAYLDGIKVQGLDARQVVENFIAELNFIPPVREPPEIGPAPDAATGGAEPAVSGDAENSENADKPAPPPAPPAAPAPANAQNR